MSDLSTEAMLEHLKHEFPTVEFLAGSVGFVVRYHGKRQTVFPYTIFMDPNFATIIVTAITLLEVG